MHGLFRVHGRYGRRIRRAPVSYTHLDVYKRQVQNTTGWWWQEDNGSYPVSQWKWLDGNKDGIYECYAFDSNGYMYADTTTPDGYTVNKEGAWTIGNSVQLKFAKDMQNESGSNDNTAADNSTSDNTVYTNEDMVGTFRINEMCIRDRFKTSIIGRERSSCSLHGLPRAIFRLKFFP